MRLRYLNLTILTSFLLFSCSGLREERTDGPDRTAGPLEVGFWMDDEGAKAAVGADLCSVVWEDDDHLALWAFDQNDAPALSAQDFSVYGRSATRAFFSSTLSSPMAEGLYTYWAAAPLPSKIQDGYASFPIPAVQDGKGDGVMFSNLTEAGPLKSVKDYGKAEKFALQMGQQLHLLRFYVQDEERLLGGEPIEKIECFFPAQVSGSLRVALPVTAEPGVFPSSEQILQEGGTDLTLQLAEPLSVSDANERHYAFATIFPRKWGKDESFSVRLYSRSKVAVADDIPLGGRDMKAAHATTVKVAPGYLREYRRVFVHFRSNPIGEPVRSITLTAPSGCKWSDKGGNTYTISPGGDIAPGTSFLLEYEDAAAFMSLSGKSITVTYDSEHLICTQNITIPDLSGMVSTTLALDVAPLLSEDFSTVNSFNSNDEHKTANAGSKSPVTFLNGWSGARCGAKAGVGVRLACRRETSADYDARMDSAPLACTIKKAVNLKLSFDYGSGGAYIMILGKAVGQTVKVGYITTLTNYKSGDTNGTYPHSFFIDKSACDGEGGYEMASTPYSCILSIPAGTSPVRISWRTVIEHMAGINNNTNWLYLDNVSVTVNP